MLSMTPGREEEFRRVSQWLAASAAVDRIIEASEREAAEPPVPPLPPRLVAAYRRWLPERVPVLAALTRVQRTGC